MWPFAVRPKQASRLPFWGLLVFPVWFFCFVTVIHAILDSLYLSGNAEGSKLQEIIRVLICSFEAFLFGLVAAQFSVAVTPWRFLRPLMALWTLALPYFFARKVAHLFAAWVGHVFSRVPPKLPNEEIFAHLTLAVISAINYSLLIRRVPIQSSEAQLQNEDDSHFRT